MQPVSRRPVPGVISYFGDSWYLGAERPSCCDLPHNFLSAFGPICSESDLLSLYNVAKKIQILLDLSEAWRSLTRNLLEATVHPQNYSYSQMEKGRLRPDELRA